MHQDQARGVQEWVTIWDYRMYSNLSTSSTYIYCPYSIIVYTPQDVSLDLQAFLGFSCYKNKPWVSTVDSSFIWDFLALVTHLKIKLKSLFS